MPAGSPDAGRHSCSRNSGDEGIVKARADKAHCPGVSGCRAVGLAKELLESTKSECFEKLKSGGAVAKVTATT